MSKHKLRLHYTHGELAELKRLVTSPLTPTMVVASLTDQESIYSELHNKWMNLPCYSELYIMTDIYNACTGQIDWPKEKLYYVHDKGADEWLTYVQSDGEYSFSWMSLVFPAYAKTKSEWLAINPAYEAMLEEIEDDKVEEENE